jgi:ribosomal-protein-alanine N-acetyltransferase
VEEQKVIVAFAIASIHKKAEQIYAYIETLEVLDGFRGRGMARLLIAELEASARGSHAAMVLLHVDCSNERAVRLYEKNGYEKVDEQEEFYPGGNTAFIYLKSLFEE